MQVFLKEYLKEVPIPLSWSKVEVGDIFYEKAEPLHTFIDAQVK